MRTMSGCSGLCLLLQVPTCVDMTRKKMNAIFFQLVRVNWSAPRMTLHLRCLAGIAHSGWFLRVWFTICAGTHLLERLASGGSFSTISCEARLLMMLDLILA